MVGSLLFRDIYSGHFPPKLSKLKTGKNLKEDFMKKGRKRGERKKKKKMIKLTLKYLYEAYMTAKKNTKPGKSFREGGEFFWLANIYYPNIYSPEFT